MFSHNGCSGIFEPFDFYSENGRTLGFTLAATTIQLTFSAFNSKLSVVRADSDFGLRPFVVPCWCFNTGRAITLACLPASGFSATRFSPAGQCLLCHRATRIRPIALRSFPSSFFWIFYIQTYIFQGLFVIILFFQNGLTVCSFCEIVTRMSILLRFQKGSLNTSVTLRDGALTELLAFVSKHQDDSQAESPAVPAHSDL